MQTNAAILTPPPPSGEMARWLRRVLPGAAVAPLAGDASARRYFRAVAGKKSYIAMDSPPSEKPAQFLAVRQLLEERGVRAPKLVAACHQRGFFLLEDFGDETYLQTAAPQNCGRLYGAAIRALVKIQKAPPPQLPEYSAAMLNEEMALYPQWYCARYLQKKLSAPEQNIFRNAAAFLAEECRAQPQVFVHRDYHSRNLMRVKNGPGVLDFQDAVIGPVAYDMVSLLRDAYWAFSETRQKQWLNLYRREAVAAGILPAAIKPATVWRYFNTAGAQRGLKVLGIFARLHARDNKSAYLLDIPRVQTHLLAACRALPELAALGAMVKQLPPPCAP